MRAGLALGLHGGAVLLSACATTGAAQESRRQPLAPELRLRRGPFFYRTGRPASASAASGFG
jgi:hypothetical protein